MFTWTKLKWEGKIWAKVNLKTIKIFLNAIAKRNDEKRSIDYERMVPNNEFYIKDIKNKAGNDK